VFAGVLLSLAAACQSSTEALPSCVGPSPTADTTPVAAAATPGNPPPAYPFAPDSVWRADIRTAPVAPDSAAMVAYLAHSVEVNYGGVAAFNAHRYQNSYYVARPGTPLVDVAFDDCQDKGYLPPGLTGPDGQFTAVPIPADAVPAAGTDSTLSVYSPSSDRLWEFWRIQKTPQGTWQACWGGRMDSVSTSPGYFLHGFGSSASGLSTTGGMVSLADVRSGAVDHAMSLVLPKPATYKRVSWPAQRSDGWDTDPRATPEGTRLRLDPAVDVDALHLSPVAAMIARAAQTYGFIVTDKGGAVSVTAEGGTAEEAVTGADPWDALLGNAPDYAVLRGFPWGSLQALPQDYGRPQAQATAAAPPCS
jgi:hypothetical protein